MILSPLDNGYTFLWITSLSALDDDTISLWEWLYFLWMMMVSFLEYDSTFFIIIIYLLWMMMLSSLKMMLQCILFGYWLYILCTMVAIMFEYWFVRLWMLIVHIYIVGLRILFGYLLYLLWMMILYRLHSAPTFFSSLHEDICTNI